jgi:hypothetical protein
MRALSIVLFLSAACVANNPGPAGPSGDPTVATNPPGLPDAAPVTTNTSTAATPPDAGIQLVNDPIYGCELDEDCYAVAKNMCCPDGTKEAINATREAADRYKSSWNQGRCPPVACPAIRKQDNRTAQCNYPTNRCEMVDIDKIACGGDIKAQLELHKCPDAYKCQLPPSPGSPGKCIK